MNSPMRTTLLMFLIAIGMVFVAMRYYPWQTAQIESNQVNEPLFPEYSAGDVKTIQIEKHVFVDTSQGVIQKFTVTQRGREWTIPSRANFPAQNVDRLADATSCLNNLIIEQLTTQDQKDYGLYGVHAPDSNAVSGKGVLFSLQSANGESIASLIVGESPEGRPDQKYVRIPGQPQVYLVTFDDRILSTDLADWIGTNLLRLTQEDTRNIRYLEFHNYVGSGEEFASAGTVKHVYRCRVDVGSQQRRSLAQIVTADESGQLVDTPEDLKLPQQQPNWLSDVAQRLGGIAFNNIRPKQDLIAEYLAEQTKDVKPIEFSSMINSGFRYHGMENEHHQFVSAAGSFSLGKGSDVRLTIYFGRLVDLERGGTSELSRLAFLTAEVDTDLLPKPEPIESDDPTEQRNYERDLRLWNEAIEKAKSSAKDFNRFHAKWFYAISESEYEMFMPPLQRLLSEAN